MIKNDDQLRSQTVNVCSELSGQLVERVATEFNKLQFYVNKCRGLPLVDEIRPVSYLRSFHSFSDTVWCSEEGWIQ